MMMISAQGFFLVIFGISVSSADVKHPSPIKEARSVPEYVLKYAYDHVESTGAGNKFLDEHSAADEEAKRITQTNTVFFKHKIIPVHYPVYGYLDYPLEKIPHSVVPAEKKFAAEHPLLRPEVKIIPFSDEKKIEHPGKHIKLVHFHYPEEKEITYTSPVHYFEDLSYAHHEKEIPFKVDKEIVHPFPLEKTLPFEILYPVHEEEKLAISLVEADSNHMKEEIKKETLKSTAGQTESKLLGEIAIAKTIPHPTHSQQKPPSNQEDSTETEKQQVPGTYPIQVNIPVRQLGKDVQVTPFLIKFEIPKEDEKVKESEASKKLESYKE